jgi:hypothetical protein
MSAPRDQSLSVKMTFAIHIFVLVFSVSNVSSEITISDMSDMLCCGNNNGKFQENLRVELV